MKKTNLVFLIQYKQIFCFFLISLFIFYVIPCYSKTEEKNNSTSFFKDSIKIKLHDLSINSLSISNDNKKLITASGDKKIKIIDLYNYKLLNTIENHTANINMAIYSPDNKLIVSCSNDKSVSFFDIENNKEIKKILFPENVSTIAFTNDSKYLAIACDNNTITIMDICDYSIIKIIKEPFFYISALAFSKDNKSLAVGSNGEKIYIFNTSNFNKINEIKHNQDYIKSLIFSDDNKTIFTSGDDGSIKSWDIFSGNLLSTYSGKNSIISLAINKDNSLLFSGSDFSEKTLKIWDIKQKKIISEFNDFNSDINFILLREKDKKLFVATGDGYLVILKYFQN